MGVQSKDAIQIQTWGRLAAQTNDPQNVKNAAEYLAIEDNWRDRQTLKSYFEEGVRNYADGQDHCDLLMRSVEQETRILTTKE